MDGWESRFFLFLRLTPRPFTPSPSRCISTGKECNVLWSPLFPLPFVSLSFCLSEHRLPGCVEKEILQGFALHPPSNSSNPPPFDLFITSSSLFLLCFFLFFPFCSTLPSNGNTFYYWWLSTLFFSYWCYIHYLMGLTFGLVKVTVHKLSVLRVISGGLLVQWQMCISVCKLRDHT